MLHEEITGPIIGAFYDVYNTLGYGFLERVYENSLAFLLVQRGLRVHQQAPLSVELVLANTSLTWLSRTRSLWS